MADEMPFRLEVEWAGTISHRGTAVIGVILQGVLHRGDILAVEGREHVRAECTGFDAALRSSKTLEDGLPRVGLQLPELSPEGVSEGDVLVAVRAI